MGHPAGACGVQIGFLPWCLPEAEGTPEFGMSYHNAQALEY
jgi:hypothetical protein